MLGHILPIEDKRPSRDMVMRMMTGFETRIARPDRSPPIFMSFLNISQTMDQRKMFKVGFLKINGQTGLNKTKQKQIESFIFRKNMQETDINEDTFSLCSSLSSSYNIIPNNSPTKYTSTSVLFKSDLEIYNIQFDDKVRAISFDICGITNLCAYLPSGSDPHAKSGRGEYCSTILSRLLLNR